MNRSMSVPLLLAVPFANEPLGSTLTNLSLAHSLMIGSILACTPRTGDRGPVSTASRSRML